MQFHISKAWYIVSNMVLQFPCNCFHSEFAGFFLKRTAEKKNTMDNLLGLTLLLNIFSSKFCDTVSFTKTSSVYPEMCGSV